MFGSKLLRTVVAYDITETQEGGAPVHQPAANRLATP
jgi:hypothetical protein